MSTRISASKKLEKKYGRLTFARALKAWREADDFSQSEFAKKLGIARQTLNDLERGRKIPSPKRAALIARKIGFSEETFISIALRDALYKEGLKFNVRLESA